MLEFLRFVRPFSPISGGGLNPLTAHLDLWFENFCWLNTNPSVSALYLYKQKSFLDDSQDSSSKKKMPRWPRYFFQVLWTPGHAHFFSFLKVTLYFSFSPGTSHFPMPNTHTVLRLAVDLLLRWQKQDLGASDALTEF